MPAAALARQMMPEEKLPDLEPVYATLGEDYEAMDALDAVAFRHPYTAVGLDIAAHCCPELNTREAASEIGARLRRVNAAMREHCLRVRGERVSDCGTHLRRYAYRICELYVVLAVLGLTAPNAAIAEPMVAYRKAPIEQRMVQCNTRANIIETLEKRYGEERRIHALTGGDEKRFIEIFVGESGAWTIIETRPGGVTCLVRAGSDWHVVPQGRRM